MKGNILIILISIGLITNAYGQKQKKHFIGGYYYWGKSDYSSAGGFVSNSLDHTDYEWKNHYTTIGIEYSYRTSEMIESFIGLSLTTNGFSTTNHYFRDWKSYESDHEFLILSIPVHFRIHFSKYLFADGGISLNYHPKNTWGIGPELSCGAEYTFKSQLSISLRPQIQWNILDLGNRNENSFGIEILKQMGINIGLGYRF